MIDTILLDLDGTLLSFTQEAFIAAYFAEIGKVFVKLGLDVGKSVKAVWAGTKAMMANDGGETNRRRFWETFADRMELDEHGAAAAEAACDSFYSNEFDAVKSVLRPSGVPRRLVREMARKGYGVALATNPLFPACAVATRLGWAGLEPRDFKLVTHYSNSAYCKPNPGYYREIFAKLGKRPEQCLMAGNSPSEDMAAGALGAETFLVTGCLENETGMDITGFRRGTLVELEEYLMGWPDIAL